MELPDRKRNSPISLTQLIQYRSMSRGRTDRPTDRAGLTIRHGTYVRRAPSWKGAPEWHAAKILSMSFSLRCRRRNFCVNFVTQKNPQKELQTWSPNGCHCQWRKDSRRRRTFMVDSSTVAENSESSLTCLCSVATYGVHQSWGPPARAPIFCKGTIYQSPSMIILQHVIKSLKCITNFKWSTTHRLSTVATVLLMNFWSCKLANLRNQKSFSCADNGSIAYLHWRSLNAFIV